jgi:hypothetical protein
MFSLPSPLPGYLLGFLLGPEDRLCSSETSVKLYIIIWFYISEGAAFTAENVQ